MYTQGVVHLPLQDVLEDVTGKEQYKDVQIDKVLLVGGSSRIPKVRMKLCDQPSDCRSEGVVRNFCRAPGWLLVTELVLYV